MRFTFFYSRAIASVLIASLLSACATSQDRVHLNAPNPITDMYSEAEVKLSLAIEPSLPSNCQFEQCDADTAFTQQVADLGARLQASAFVQYPELKQHIKAFNFEISNKAEPGTASTSRGKVVVFRGVQKMQLDDTALAFVMAREMGHVIAKHHHENTSHRILLSVAMALLFPAYNLINGSTTAVQISSVASTTTTTATSMLGSKLMMASLKPEQLVESDRIALGLLHSLGWQLQDIAASIDSYLPQAKKNAWLTDYGISTEHIQAIYQTELLAIAVCNDLPALEAWGEDVPALAMEPSSPVPMVTEPNTTELDDTPKSTPNNESH